MVDAVGHHCFIPPTPRRLPITIRRPQPDPTLTPRPPNASAATTASASASDSDSGSGPCRTNAVIKNDPVILSNVRGTIAYAAVTNNKGIAVNRTTQVFVNYANNSNLDAMGFTPFGVINDAGMAVLDSVYAKYGQNPSQEAIYNQGDAYLQKHFPLLSYITGTTVTVTTP
jgi:hypothetical protein